MNALLSIWKRLADVLAIVAMGWLLLALGVLTFDVYQFVQDPEPYRVVYEGEASADWQVHYLQKVLLVGLAALATLLLLSLSFRRSAKPWQVTVRQTLGPGFVLLLILAYWQWTASGFDH